MRTRHIVLSLLIALAFAASLGAQSFLGTIRGTVVDPQGGAVKGAAVLITDEATNTPRTVDTDAEGRYEVVNLKPGTYRVEVVTPNFKKFEQTNVLVRAAGTALVDVTLDVGGVNETVTVSGEAANNITLDSPAISRGLDAQQLHDLPRNSRDIQSFLLLNPNVVGGFDDMQFLGGRTYGVSYIQDGQASTNAIFGTIGNSAPGLDAVSEIQVLSNSYSAEYGGLAGVVVTTKRGGLQYRGTGFYDYNGDGLNALTYNQTLAGVERGDPNSDTHEHRWGASIGGPLIEREAVLLRQLRGLEQQGHLRRISRERADGGHASRRFPRHLDPSERSRHRRALRGPDDSVQSHRPVRDKDHELLLPAAESVGRCGRRLRGLSTVRARDVQETAGGHPTRQRSEQERQPVLPRKLPASRSDQASRSRPATRSRTCLFWTPGSTPPR